MTEVLDHLAHVPLFGRLDGERLADVASLSFLQKFPAHVTLLEQDTRPDFLFIVIDGSVELTAECNGTFGTLTIGEAGYVFGMPEIVLDRPSLYLARTVTPSRIILVPSAAVRQLARADHDFTIQAIQQLAKFARSLVREHNSLKIRSSVERVATWILRQHQANGHTRFRFPYQKRVLASLLAMSTESLARAFTLLEPNGVSVTRHDVTIHDLDALARVADQSEVLDDPI